MAGKKIQYVVDVDYSDLRKLGQEFENAGRTAKQSFTGLEGALARANADINGVEAALRGTTAAFNAVKAASGGAFSDDEVVAYVQSLNRMGASFDEIVADADRVADSLKRATDVNLGATVDGADQVSASMKRVAGEADNSRSVMANMAGNTAQDLGEVAGVAGTLGVGLGQLAEYAAEGNISLSGLAKVAGPMAALGAATALVAAGMADASKVKAFDAERAKQFTEAIAAGGTAMGSLRDEVAATGELLSSQGGLFGGDFFGGIDDLVPRLQKVGLSFSQFQTLVEDPAALNALIAYRDGLDATTEAAKRSDLQHVIDGIRDYQGAVEDATRTQDALNEFLDVTPDMVEASFAAFEKGRDIAANVSGPWDTLIAFVREGGEASDATALAMERLTEETGLTEEAIWGVIDTKLADELQANADAADKAAAALVDHAAAAKQARTATEDMARVMGSVDYDAAGIEAAAAALQEWFQATPAGGGGGVQIISDYNEAIQGLGSLMQDMNEATGDAGIAGMILGISSTDEQRQQLDTLEELGTSIMPRITQAFEESDGTFESFAGNVSDLSDSIHDDLVVQLMAAGSSAEEAEEQANALQQRLGLIPENVETLYRLLGDADATAKLGLIQGYIDNLPASVQTEVAMHILADDPQAALSAVTTYIANHPMNAPVGLNTTPALNDYAQLRAILDRTVKVPVTLQATNTLASQIGPAKGGGPRSVAPSSSAPAAASFGVAAVPAAAVTVPYTVPYSAPAVTVPVNVTVNAAVIGNRYDVTRTVAEATRTAIRLAGRRHLLPAGGRTP